MAFTPGARLGPYEIIAAIGVGGMGEVYRAKDTRLGREVAIKVLPPELSGKRDRLERFEQEARSASALNHPNIITVFDIGTEGTISYMAMEFVQGKTLRELLSSGPIPLRKTISIAAQFADGLAKAHSAGIVHRDLKPENLMISQDGFLKILDFGLSKAVDLPSAKASVLPTVAHTDAGTILGTVGYMSPEQASGTFVDFRSDQFSFGSILYEMITGKRAFARNTPVQSLSAIIQEDPEPVATLIPQTPAPVRWIVERCMAKDPEDRYASTRDLARELQSVRDHFSDLGSSTETSASVATFPVTPVMHRRRKWSFILPWFLAVLLALALAVQMLRGRTETMTKGTLKNVEISLPPGHQLAPSGPLAFAPDGSAIVLCLVDPFLQVKLWMRRLDRFDLVPLEGTQGGTYPFWSPDSKSIAFFVDSENILRRLDIATGTIQTICKTMLTGTLGRASVSRSSLRGAQNALSRGGDWALDGTIIFAPGSNAPLFRVPASGGEVVKVTNLDPKILDGSHRFPVFLPDGHHFLFTVWSNHLETAGKVGGIYLGSLDKGELRRLTSDTSQSILGKNSMLVYRNESLVELSFDVKNFQLSGTSKEIVTHPLFFPASGLVEATLSKNGDLAFAIASGEGTGLLSWLDRKGIDLGGVGRDRLGVESLTLSPDGSRFVASVVSRAGAQVWVGDTKREILTRLTRGGSDANMPIWSPDGAQIAFNSDREGSECVYIQPADGSHAPKLTVLDPARHFQSYSWSNDGRYLFMDSNLKNEARSELWVYDFSEIKSRAILADASTSLTNGTLSPDGRWLAYASDESGNQEVYVRSFPSLDRKSQISSSGGSAPHWRNDGREILFLGPDLSVHTAQIEVKNDTLEASSPVLLFAPKRPVLALAPSADHNRFLVSMVPEDARSEPIRLMLGWQQ